MEEVQAQWEALLSQIEAAVTAGDAFVRIVPPTTAVETALSLNDRVDALLRERACTSHALGALPLMDAAVAARAIKELRDLTDAATRPLRMLANFAQCARAVAARPTPALVTVSVPKDAASVAALVPKDVASVVAFVPKDAASVVASMPETTALVPASMPAVSGVKRKATPLELLSAVATRIVSEAEPPPRRKFSYLHAYVEAEARVRFDGAHVWRDGVCSIAGPHRHCHHRYCNDVFRADSDFDLSHELLPQRCGGDAYVPHVACFERAGPYNCEECTRMARRLARRKVATPPPPPPFVPSWHWKAITTSATAAATAAAATANTHKA